MEEPKYHLEGVIRSRDELEDFEGPLDVILLLLSKNKIEIRDIQISSILEQYLAYLDEMKRLDLEIASEFIAMASHLMYIKSKMLLSYSDQEEALSEMEILIRSLEERRRQEAYNQIRDAAKQLEPRSAIGLGMFTKPQEPPPRQTRYRYEHDPADLVAAFARMSARSEQQLPPPVAAFAGIVGREPYPVTKKAAQILSRLLKAGVTKFRSLFHGSRSRSEIVATFMAVLELCRLSSVRVDPNDKGELDVTYLKMPEESALPQQEE